MGQGPVYVRTCRRRERPGFQGDGARVAHADRVGAVRIRGGNILVVSHKATIRLLLSSLLGFDPRRYRDNLDQSPAALNIVDFKDLTRARLTLFNDTSHYAEAGLAIPGVPEGRLSKWWSDARVREAI